MSVVQAQVGQTADQRRVWIIFSGLMLALLVASLWGKLGDLYGRKRLFQA